MSFATRPDRDPIDDAREAIERADLHLSRVKARVAAGELKADALHVAELTRQHALRRWQDAVRGDHDQATDAPDPAA